MTTITNVQVAGAEELQPVRERGWRRGFANLLRNEHRQWWGTRKWLVHLALWMVVLNGLILLVGVTEGQEANLRTPVYDTLIQVFFGVGALATGIGVVTTAQGAIVGEKQLGTAAWVLSKPVARSAFVLAKFAAYATGFVALAVVVPSAVFVGESVLLGGRAPELSGFLSGVGLMALHALFYLALALLLGTLFSARGPVSGIALGVLFAGFLPPNLVPQAVRLVLPWTLKDSAVGLTLGSALPSVWVVPVVATAGWAAAFVGLAVWRFSREQF
jgi:ABC-2 type transport system permease protein